MDLENIKELVKILNENDLIKLEIDEEGTKIKLEKQKEYLVSASTVESNHSLPSTSATPTSCEMKTINSPIVGTFYAKPGPDEADFVKVGAKVKAGQTLCIIEAMKVMNEIKAEKDATIKNILVENGAMVEFDQPLFEIE